MGAMETEYETEEVQRPRLHGHLPEASITAACFGGALLLFGSIMLGNANHKQVKSDSLAEEYHIPTGMLGALILGVGVALILFGALAYVKMRRTSRAVTMA